MAEQPTVQSLDDEQAYAQAAALVREHQCCSVSLIQRHLRIGYNRALGLVERMQQGGVIVRAVASEDVRWQVVGPDGVPLPVPPEPPEIPVEEMLRLAREARQHGVPLRQWIEATQSCATDGRGAST